MIGREALFTTVVTIVFVFGLGYLFGLEGAKHKKEYVHTPEGDLVVYDLEKDIACMYRFYWKVCLPITDRTKPPKVEESSSKIEKTQKNPYAKYTVDSFRAMQKGSASKNDPPSGKDAANPFLRYSNP